VKSLCPHCRRETYASLPDGASEKREHAACWRGPIDVGDCDTFTAGRRAGLREALRLAIAASYDFHANPDRIAQDIRKAMKPARVKA
jgi:hypothetical protein